MPDEPNDHCSAGKPRPPVVALTLDSDAPPTPATSSLQPIANYRTVEPESATYHSDRFAFVRALNKGNLGVVSVAIDKELDREIALKHIREDRAHSAPHRDSFVREAEITGKLEHPGIVPVYSFGTDANGQLFYAMRLIRGVDLRTAIQLFHRAVAAQQVRYNSPELRELVQNLISVCHTIAYAHARGVLHRDLKPANIMLGPYGETLVVDWGLAKPTGVSSGEVEHTHKSVHDLSTDEGVLATTRSARDATMDGSIIGTPVYAPPEQLTGDLSAIDHRSDIYSLGAILYEILAGAPPLSAASLGELIATVKAGLVPAPRDVLPQVPKAISAICRRAMQPAPNDRYQSVQEFRKDLESWLYDLPVSAYEETIWERAHRWMRTHQTFVRATAVSLILIACVSTVAALLINNARNSEATARQEATQLYRLARSTTDTLLSTTSDRLAEIPDATDLREELLRSAATAYEQMAESRSADAGLKREAANSLLGLADVQRKLDDAPAAIASLQKSIAKLEELVDSPQATDADSLDLAKSLIELSRVHSDLRHDSEATGAVMRALSILDPFTSSAGAPPVSWSLRGEALIQRAIIEADRKDLLAASEAGHAAVDALRHGLERATDGEIVYNLRYQLARALVNLSYYYSSRSPQDSTVQKWLEDALQNLAWCMERQPHKSGTSQLLALAQNNLADHWLSDREDPEAARRSYEPSLKFFSKLVQEQPLIPEYKNGLILVRLGLANVAFRAGQMEEMARQSEMANQVADQLLAQNSVRSTFRVTCTHAKFAYAECITDSEPEKAMELLDEVAELLPAGGKATLFVTTVDSERISMQRELAQLNISLEDLQPDVPAGLGDRLKEFVTETDSFTGWKALINSACYISATCAALAEAEPEADELTFAKDAAFQRLKKTLAQDKQLWAIVSEQPELDFLRQNYANEFERLEP